MKRADYIPCSIKLTMHNLIDVPHDMIRELITEFRQMSLTELDTEQLNRVFHLHENDGLVMVLNQAGHLYLFNGTAILRLEDGRLYKAPVRMSY
jgi:hypothetical protein